MVQLSETFAQLCLQGVNGHVSPGENGSKTSESTNQSGSLMSDSLTVTWPKESWNRDHISYCCCNVEVPEHWDLEGGSNGSEFGNQEGYLFPVLCPLPFARQQINQEHKMSVYFPFSPTLCLAFEDSGGLQSCLKQCLFPAPFPLAWLSLWPFTEGREECVSPWRVLNHHVGRVPGTGEVGSCDSDSGSDYSRTSLLSVAKLTEPPVKEQAPSTGIIHVDQEDFAVGAALG